MPTEGIKRNPAGSALLLLDAVLGLQRNCVWTTKRESRLKRRNYRWSLFPKDVGVKENREMLLCKSLGLLPISSKAIIEGMQKVAAL